MVEFSLATAANFIDEDSVEEPGEVVDSAPPQEQGEEREIRCSDGASLKKKLLKPGNGWETPEFGDEVTVHYVGFLLEGTQFVSTRGENQPFTFKLGQGVLVSGLDHGIMTMTKGETALFTLPPELAYGVTGTDGVPPNTVTLFEVELISWITVVDVCKDGGIIKRILKKGDQTGPPGDLDEVLVRYSATTSYYAFLPRTTGNGVEFHLRDGHLCPALPKVIKTMRTGERVNLIIQCQYAFNNWVKISPTSSAFNPKPEPPPLCLDLELVSFKPVIDVTGDLGVLKKILKEGEGTPIPNEGATVRIRYSAKLQDGTLFEKKGFDAEMAFEFRTDEEQVVTGLDRAVSTMKKGEIAIVTVKPEYGFESNAVKCDLASVPPNSTLIYEVEMLQLTRAKERWEITFRERIEAATKKKEVGNALYKNGKYQKALEKYDKAADYLTEGGPFEGDDEKRIKAFQAVCWLNTAACSYKLGNFQEAIKQCSMVLKILPSNVKALYRRAKAYMRTHDLHLAELDIKRSLKKEPENSELKLLQENLKQLQAESNKRDVNLFAPMFSRKLDENGPDKKRLKAGTEEGKNYYSKDSIAMEVDKDGVKSQGGAE